MSLRFACLALCLLPLACTSNTIDLESEGASEADPSTSGDPTGGRTGVDETGRPTIDDSGRETEGPSTATEGPSTATEGPNPTIPPEPLTMLLAIESSIQPGLPFQGLVTLTPTGGDTFDLELQWLSLDPGSTNFPREPVGDVYVYSGLAFDPDGGFAWSSGVILLPGAANPVTGGDLVISANLQAVPDGSPYCGRVRGEVLEPIAAPLDGSTHAMTEVDPDNLPEEFPVTCP